MLEGQKCDGGGVRVSSCRNGLKSGIYAQRARDTWGEAGSQVSAGELLAKMCALGWGVLEGFVYVLGLGSGRK